MIATIAPRMTTFQYSRLPRRSRAAGSDGAARAWPQHSSSKHRDRHQFRYRVCSARQRRARSRNEPVASLPVARVTAVASKERPGAVGTPGRFTSVAYAAIQGSLAMFAAMRRASSRTQGWPLARRLTVCSRLARCQRQGRRLSLDLPDGSVCTQCRRRAHKYAHPRPHRLRKSLKRDSIHGARRRLTFGTTQR